eukprot:TRINITY_DN30393_c0_g1_i1.p1 TRINITY_DN30393_c0_g1~~TRINITY_DN30393_c0_g1_i1.p1  ORF type:complete len:715 (-),score=108.69 TRINITY_DN30393_c0_g1_i1:82-2136(-)
MTARATPPGGGGSRGKLKAREETCLSDLVVATSGGRVALAEDAEVGRHLVALKDLKPGVAVLTEEALLWGSDEGRWLRSAVTEEDADGMFEAWQRPSGGGSNPLAHIDLFCNFVLSKAAAATDSTTAAAASQRLLEKRLQTWFCQPNRKNANDLAQNEKLAMIRAALRPHLRRHVTKADLRLLDDICTRNAEEFVGAVDIHFVESEFGEEHPSYLGRRRFQGIFPCKDLIQHSCAPNCLCISGPTRHGQIVLQVIPLKAIKKGDQLSWCYLPYWKWLWPTQLRRQALKEGWDFLCCCKRCDGSMPEVSMVFVCPRCSSNDLCPLASVSAFGDVVGDASHLLALEGVCELICRHCGLHLRRGASAGPGGFDDSAQNHTIHCRRTNRHVGYLERCIEQEKAAFSLPWRGVRGRNPRAAGAQSVNLLSPSHWLFVDHASHELENAALIARNDGLTEMHATIDAVGNFLRRLGANASIVSCAILRLLGGVGRHVALPEVSFLKALCTGVQTDFDDCFEHHRCTFGNSLGSSGMVDAFECLCKCRREFITTRFEKNFAEVCCEGMKNKDALAAEHTHVCEWLGISPRSKVAEPFLWVLRRMWVYPDLGCSTGCSLDGEEETGACCGSGDNVNSKEMQVAQTILEKDPPAESSRGSRGKRKLQVRPAAHVAVKRRRTNPSAMRTTKRMIQ